MTDTRKTHLDLKGLAAVEPPCGCAAPAEALACLLATTHELDMAADLQSGLEHLAERLRHWVRYDNLAILMLDELGHELRFEVTVGYSDEVVKHWKFGLGQGIVGSVAQSGEPILANDVTSDPRYLSAAPETKAELALPLKVKDRVIGVLDLGSHQKNAFDDASARVLGLLARSLAGAIDRQRLYENTRNQARTLSLLHELSRELTSILDRKALLERLAERLRPLLDYDTFSVLLWDESSRQLEPWVAVSSQRAAVTWQHPIDLGRGITGTAAALRQPIRVPNVTVDPRHVQCDPNVNIRSELAVPLVFEDRLIGVLDLESTRYDAFSLEHELLVSTLSSSLAIALVNAETYENACAKQEELDRDLAMARKVQRQLLPSSSPWVPGLQVAAANESARHLGGDFYDFLRYGDGRVAIALGDVAGKSTSAALYASLAIGVLREYASHSRPGPAEVLAQMNAKLRELEVKRRFLALTFATYDASSRILTVANSGLPYPILAQGGTLRELELGGIPVGLLGDTEYREVEVPLAPGDTVVFASDGISEALNPQGEEFGGDRVRETVARLLDGSSHDVAHGLLAAVEHFADGSEPSDDRTVVVLRA